MSALLERLQTRFGFEGLPDAIFHRAPFGLRFELGDEWAVETDQVTRFLQAMDRSRAVCEAAFADSKTVLAVLRLWGTRRPSPRARTLRRLASMGFRPALTFGCAYAEPDAEPPVIRTYFYESGPTTAADRAVLLWDACATEIGVEPSSEFMGVAPDQFGSLLVDFERGVLVHVYDDRGMDVIGADLDVLRPLYHQFGDWLADHGRERMVANFEA
jgi:hypothetical protein